MKPRLLIIDDEAPARSRLKTLLSDIEADCPHELVGEATGAQQALDAIAVLHPDVLLLDVQMPVMSGIDLAAQLVRLPDPPAVVFVTAFDEFALKAFEVHAADYLLKPVRAQRLAESIKRAIALRPKAGSRLAALTVDLQPARRHFSVQERGRVVLVPVSDVVYCKAELKYVTLRTCEREYLVEESLTSIEEEFGQSFVRVHRSALVAHAFILGVERGAHNDAAEAEKGAQDSWQVILRGVEERLPISRRQWSVVKALVR